MLTMRHSVAGNALTIAMSTYCAVLSVLPTWVVKFRNVGDKLVIGIRGVTESYILANQSQTLII